MNKKFLTNTLYIFVIILVSYLGYVFLVKKPTVFPKPTPNPCIDESNSKDGKNLPPIISSVSPSSGSIGAKIEIRGCNLAGFEGDQKVIFERSDGKKLTFYGSGYNEKTLTITLANVCPSGSEIGRYSGKITPCETIKALPGIYKVYVTTWGDDFKSNMTNFTIK